MGCNRFVECGSLLPLFQSGGKPPHSKNEPACPPLRSKHAFDPHAQSNNRLRKEKMEEGGVV